MSAVVTDAGVEAAPRRRAGPPARDRLRRLHVRLHGAAEGRPGRARGAGQPDRLARDRVRRSGRTTAARRSPARASTPRCGRSGRPSPPARASTSSRRRCAGTRSALRDWLVAERITVSFLPTRGGRGADRPRVAGPTARCATCSPGGDALTTRPAPGLPFTVVNNYGLSETAVVATSGPVAPEGDGAPTIGRPISGIVARGRRRATSSPCAPGDDGELVLGGVAVGARLPRPPRADRGAVPGRRRRRPPATAPATGSASARTARSSSSGASTTSSASAASASSPARSPPRSTPTPASTASVAVGVGRAPRRPPARRLRRRHGRPAARRGGARRVPRARGCPTTWSRRATSGSTRCPSPATARSTAPRCRARGRAEPLRGARRRGAGERRRDADRGDRWPSCSRSAAGDRPGRRTSSCSAATRCSARS